MKLRDAKPGQCFLLLDGHHQGKICEVVNRGDGHYYQIDGKFPNELGWRDSIQLLRPISCDDLKDGQEAYIIKWPQSKRVGQKVARLGLDLKQIGGVDYWTDFFIHPVSGTPFGVVDNQAVGVVDNQAVAQLLLPTTIKALRRAGFAARSWCRLSKV